MPCHRNAMGSNRQTVPKECGKNGEREREIKVLWIGDAPLSAIRLISSLQPPLDFSLSRHRSSTLPFRTPFRRLAGEPKLSWASIVFLLSCCFTLGLVLPERDGIPAFPSLWSWIQACSELSDRDSLITLAAHKHTHTHTLLSTGHNPSVAVTHGALQGRKHFGRSPLETVIIHHWLHTKNRETKNFAFHPKKVTQQGQKLSRAQGKNDKGGAKNVPDISNGGGWAQNVLRLIYFLNLFSTYVWDIQSLGIRFNTGLK